MPAIYLICAWILAVALIALWKPLWATLRVVFSRAYYQWTQKRRQAKPHTWTRRSH